MEGGPLVNANTAANPFGSYLLSGADVNGDLTVRRLTHLGGIAFPAVGDHFFGPRVPPSCWIVQPGTAAWNSASP